MPAVSSTAGGAGRAEILPAAERHAAPWKNGCGVTREVAVRPPRSDLDHFDWRVSIAEVHAGGPFSVFPGVDRSMAILEGRLSVAIEGREAAVLSADTPPLSFPGETPVTAEPLGPRVTDLNVMTRRGRFEARLTRSSLAQAQTLSPALQATLILALSPLRVSYAQDELRLEELDAVLFERRRRCRLQPTGAAASYWLIEITALC